MHVIWHFYCLHRSHNNVVTAWGGLPPCFSRWHLHDAYPYLSMRVMRVGVVRMISSCYANGMGICMVKETKLFSRTFKTLSGATNARGRWWARLLLDKEVVYQSKLCGSVFENGLDLRFVDCPNLTCATTLPLYGKGHYWLPRPILAWILHY